MVGGRRYSAVESELTLTSGLGQTLSQVISGRLIAGVGGAGINCLVSIVIAGMSGLRRFRLQFR